MFFSPEIKEQMQRNILSRLKKIEGQIRGLQGMVGGDRNCDDILTQVRAAQSALKSVSRLVLKSYLLKCYSEIGEKPSPEEVLEKMDKTVTILSKFIGG
ncbi:MAG: metal-sensitive transcriptional regulator [Syntrophobacterales bacterium]|jgi:DNA-binding FrmR family transcriptional regulator|nr:metal-sensitive transcriptional regulator [Syntrophobacterales bacterium]